MEAVRKSLGGEKEREAWNSGCLDSSGAILGGNKEVAVGATGGVPAADLQEVLDGALGAVQQCHSAHPRPRIHRRAGVYQERHKHLCCYVGLQNEVLGAANKEINHEND